MLYVLTSSNFCTEGCYKLKILELIKRKNLVLGLIQENSIENSVQDWGRDGVVEINPHSIYRLCLPQTYFRLWVQFLSNSSCWETA